MGRSGYFSWLKNLMPEIMRIWFFQKNQDGVEDTPKTGREPLKSCSPPGNVLDAFCSELELEGGPKKVASLGEKNHHRLWWSESRLWIRRVTWVVMALKSF